MAAAPHRPKNWLLIKFRDYHGWLGVALSIFIVVICVTGVYLNHKDVFNSLARLDGYGPRTAEARATAERMKDEQARQSPRRERAAWRDELRTGTDLAALPLSFSEALALARARWGDAPIEKIELKDEHGELVYKIVSLDEREVLIGVASRAATERLPKNDWGKFIKDLHTGKVAGLGGKFFVDFTSLVIIGLTATGLYLWGVPILRKRQSRRDREALAAKSATPEPVSAV